jgi:two-component system, chemotaxis family, protein-glutamate methylesterase/glutaminase
VTVARSAPTAALPSDQSVATVAPAVTVVLVDDSGAERRFLRNALSDDAGVSVVGEARTGRDALALVERFRPSAVVLALDLPGNAIEIIERIMASVPTAILACTEVGEADLAAAALAAGAVDVVARPRGADADRGGYAEAVRRGVRVASRVKVITHPRGNFKSRGLNASVTGATAGRPASGSSESRHEGTVDLVAIGASTGGPQALVNVLGAMPASFGPAILVVQHMADGFIEGLASWLDGLCALPVAVGEAGRRLLPGTVTIAPSARNTLVHEHLRITVVDPPATQFHVPGVDATFDSIAANIGPRAIGVLLTGMGRDGAVGLKSMRDAGAITIGQDEESSAVWGMPAAAAACGAVQRQLPLSEIAQALVSIVSGDPFGGER